MCDAFSFLRSLYGDDAPGVITIWTRQNKRTHRFPAHELDKAATTAISLAKDFDVYFGVGLRKTALTPEKRGGSKDIIAVPGLWLDLDVQGPTHKNVKLPTSLDEAMNFIREFPLQPSAIVHTGGGLQCYWLLDRLWVLSDENARLKAEDLLKRFQGVLRARAAERGWVIDSTHDLARVLRLPGTLNHKAGHPLAVTLLELNDRRYSLADLEVFVPDAPVPAKPSLPAEIPDAAWAELWCGVPEGQRHNTALRLVGHLLGKKFKPAEVRVLLHLWNSRNLPPLPEDELDRIINDLAKKEQAKNPEQKLKLPESCYMGVLKDFCDLMTSFYEVPREYWFFSLTTVIGAAIAGKLTLASDLKVESRLFTVLLGRSGVEKKSTAIRRTLAFVQGTGYLPPISYGVGSGEGLAEALEEYKNLLLAVDEFRTVMAKARIENSILGPMLCTLFEGNDYESRTRGKRIKINNARLSMLAASTYDSYQLVWDSHSLAIGLNNRLLVVAAESDRVVPLVGKIPEERQQRLQTQLRQLFETLDELQERSSFIKVHGVLREVRDRGPVELVLTPDAQELWRRWYLTRPQDVYSVRLDTIGQRLMLIFAFAQGNFREIDADTVRAVSDLLEWQHKVRMAHDPIDAGNEVAKMEEAIRRQLGARGPLSRRDLKRFTHAHRAGEWIFRTALENLLAAREVTFDRASGCFVLVG